MKRKANTQPLTMLTVAELAAQTSPYRLVVDGNALAPQIMHADQVKITPLCCAPSPLCLEPGSLILIAVAQNRDALKLRRFITRGLYRLNGDGDAIAGRIVIDRGSFLLLGIAEPLTTREAPLPEADRAPITTHDDAHDGRPYHDPPSDPYRNILDPRD